MPTLLTKRGRRQIRRNGHRCRCPGQGYAAGIPAPGRPPHRILPRQMVRRGFFPKEHPALDEKARRRRHGIRLAADDGRADRRTKSLGRDPAGAPHRGQAAPVRLPVAPALCHAILRPAVCPTPSRHAHLVRQSESETVRLARHPAPGSIHTVRARL